MNTPTLLPAFDLGEVLYGHFRDINVRMKRLVSQGKFLDVKCDASGRWRKYFFTKAQALDFNNLISDKGKREAGRKFIEDFFAASTRTSQDQAPAPSPSPPSPAPEDNVTDLGSTSFDGDDLHCFRDEKGQGLVSVQSVCRPFGKDVNYEVKCLQEELAALPPDEKPWANLRIIRGVATDGSVRELWAINIEAIPMFVASFSPRGMRKDTIIKHARYKRECAKALYDYCTRGVASNPRFSEEQRRKSFEDDNARIASIAGEVAKAVVVPVIAEFKSSLTVMTTMMTEKIDTVATVLSDRMDHMEVNQPVVVGDTPITGPVVVVPWNREECYTQEKLNLEIGLSPGCTIAREVAKALGMIGDAAHGFWDDLVTGTGGVTGKQNWKFSPTSADTIRPHMRFYKTRVDELKAASYKGSISSRAEGETIARITEKKGTGTEMWLTRTVRRTRRVPSRMVNVTDINSRRRQSGGEQQ